MVYGLWLVVSGWFNVKKNHVQRNYQRSFNGRSTVVQRSFNGRSTVVQRSLNF
jgi:hypothetical protein